MFVVFFETVVHMNDELYLYVWMLQEDDEHTIDEDEAQITEAERNEELAALEAEADLPLDAILKMYTKTKGDLQQQFSLTHFHT